MPQSRRPLRIGLIADTHGLLRPEALERLRGCDQLIHAGDIGKPEILAELERLAPLSVVRGNNDTQDWAADIPERLLLKIGRLTSMCCTTSSDSTSTRPPKASTWWSPDIRTSR